MNHDVQTQNDTLERALARVPETWQPLASRLAGSLAVAALAISWGLGMALIPLMILAMTGVLN